MTADRTYAEKQFLLDNGDWFVCRLNQKNESAELNMRRVINATIWVYDNTDPETAFVFGGTFYFKNYEDHFQFSLIWG